MMAVIRQQFNNAAWFNWGYTVARVSGTSFTVVTATGGWNTVTLPASFVVGGRIKLFDTSTMYGTIDTVSASAASTNVTFTPDSGSLTSSFTSVANSIIEPTNSPIPGSGGGGGTGGAGGFDNILLNSNFQIAQLGTSFTSATTPANSDDTYLLDQWILLSDGNDTVDVTQNTAEAPTGSGYCIALDVETANRKFALLQILEAKRSNMAIGERVSLSFKAKKGSGNATLETLRAAVIAWDSTADTVTSDVISAWAVAGTDPTLVANWTYENTPSNLTLTTAYQTFKIENVLVDTASTTNVAVLIWVDDTDATVADLLYISDVKLEINNFATTYQPIPWDIDYQACLRFLEKSFAYSTAPAQNVGDNTDETLFNQIIAASTSQNWIGSEFTVIKRIAPHTITTYNTAAANAQIRNQTRGTDCTLTTVARIGDGNFVCTATTPGGSAVTDLCGLHWLADARL